MSTKQCEDMLVGKGVRPTAARILVLQKLSERTSPDRDGLLAVAGDGGGVGDVG